jgi:hypothetical protein
LLQKDDLEWCIKFHIFPIIQVEQINWSIDNKMKTAYDMKWVETYSKKKKENLKIPHQTGRLYQIPLLLAIYKRH